MNQPMNTVEIDYSQGWQKRYLKTIEQNYCQTPHFKTIYPTIYEIIVEQYNNLAQLNIQLLTYILWSVGYKGEVILASDLGLNPNLKATDLLVEICKKVGADTYLSGISGKDYLELENFGDIKVKFQQFFHPWYYHNHGEFIPCLSSLDLLMNYGSEVQCILNSKGGICLRHILDTQIPNWQNLKILEMFGGNGNGQLYHYAQDTNNLNIWEIDSNNYLTLEYQYPRANIFNFNTLDAINYCTDKFDIIIIDAPATMDLSFLNNIYKLIDKEGYLIIRAIKQSWNHSPDVQSTKSLEETSKDLYNLKVVNMIDFPREYCYDKLWLSNYFYKVII
jgi:hypothetical protein